MTPAMTDERARHDFKNQLAIIRGFAELLLADQPGDRQRRDLEEIYKAAVSALALLDRLYPVAGTEPGTRVADAGGAHGFGFRVLSFAKMPSLIAVTMRGASAAHRVR